MLGEHRGRGGWGPLGAAAGMLCAVVGILLGAVAVSACAQAGTPDRGTLTAVSDSTTFRLTNAASGKALGVAGQSQTAGALLAQQRAGSDGAQWHAIPMNNSRYNVENMLTHQLMGIADGATDAGAQAMQWADDSAADHLWEFYLLRDGNYLVRNVKSGLYLEGTVRGRRPGEIVQNARSAGACQEWRLTVTGSSPYPNPATVRLGDTAGRKGSVHDPSMVKVGSEYYLFGTHGTLHGYRSTDRVKFTEAGDALAALPAWTEAYDGSKVDLWAPDVSVHAGKFWMYYAASTFGSSKSGVGLAVSATGVAGTYVDSGAAVYTSASCAGSNAIDPASVVDAAGDAWMLFGSWSNGLFVVPVNAATGIPTGARCTLLARRPNGLEGGFIYRHGAYFYLLASVNRCCAGVASTYRIVVGRARAVTGPYMDRGGLAMASGGGTILLSAHGDINGPGGQTVLSDADGDVLVYHYYDGSNQGAPALGMNRLGWTADGWPYVMP